VRFPVVTGRLYQPLHALTTHPEPQGALTSMLTTNTALLPYRSATDDHKRLVKNWVMKNTETRLPVQSPTVASMSEVGWEPAGTKKSVVERMSGRWGGDERGRTFYHLENEGCGSVCGEEFAQHGLGWSSGALFHQRVLVLFLSSQRETYDT
jgi:hypothetical protein